MPLKKKAYKAFVIPKVAFEKCGFSLAASFLHIFSVLLLQQLIHWGAKKPRNAHVMQDLEQES